MSKPEIELEDFTTKDGIDVRVEDVDRSIAIEIYEDDSESFYVTFQDTEEEKMISMRGIDIPDSVNERKS